MSCVAFSAKYVGNYVEWACKRCGYVVQSKNVPPRGEEHCSGCAATLGLANATLGIVDLIAERDRLKARVTELEKENGELLDVNHELRGRWQS